MIVWPRTLSGGVARASQDGVRMSTALARSRRPQDVHPEVGQRVDQVGDVLVELVDQLLRNPQKRLRGIGVFERRGHVLEEERRHEVSMYCSVECSARPTTTSRS
jgi:hypothetical protein